MGDTFNDIERILDVVREEAKRAIDEYKKSEPVFKAEIEKLFSMSLDLQQTTSTLVRLVMQYAEHPKRALHIIPSIMKTTEDILVTKKNYERAKKFPHLYPYRLTALRRQYESLKHLWNQKVWSLIVISGLSTKIERSIWSSLQQAESLSFEAI
ncbi:MAG: hypothetical protein ACTSSG_07290 [Candidatus Heimdallarchaeaceae archaeon]